MRSKPLIIFGLGAVFGITLILLLQKSKPLFLNPSANKTSAVVSRVIDGDTIELANGDRVRLIGIDTPERGRPYYEEAKNKLAELVEDKTVKLEPDISERDKYGRLLRYIWLGGACINLEMVRQGYANSYTYPPDIKYQDRILAAQKQAQEQQIGLWRPNQKKISSQGPYVASSFSPVFHHSSCRSAQRIAQKNKQYFQTPKGAIQTGRRPCKICNP